MTKPSQISRFAILGAALIAVALAYVFTSKSADQLFITAPIERGVMSEFVKATGIVDAVLTVDVSSQLSGRVAEVLVNFNDVVKKGSVIARLDPDVYDARVKEARAALRVAQADSQLQSASIQRAEVAHSNAETARKIEEAQLSVGQAKQEELERDYERFLKLAQNRSASDRDMTQARSLRDAGAASLRVIEQQIKLKAEGIEIATAEIAMARARLANAEAVVEQKQAALVQAEVDRERTQIRAPIDGVIIRRDVNPGQTVAVTLEAKTLFKIAHDLREMEVRGRIDEADVGKVRVGQDAKFTVDAYPDRLFSGRVLQIRKAPETTQNVVTYTGIISAHNPDALLLPGMTATLQIVVGQSDSTLKIPSQALRFRPAGYRGISSKTDNGTATVWLLSEEGNAQPSEVRLGKNDGNSVQILSDNLAEGQKVIVGVATSHRRASWFGIRLGY